MDANKFAAALGKEAKMPITAGRLKSTRPGMPVMSTPAAKAPASPVLPTGAGGFGAAKPAMPNIRQVTAPESGSTPVRATTSANDSVASAGPMKQSAVPGIATAAGAGMPAAKPNALRGNMGDIFQGPKGRGLLPPAPPPGPATAPPGVPKVPMAAPATYKMGADGVSTLPPAPAPKMTPPAGPAVKSNPFQQPQVNVQPPAAAAPPAAPAPAPQQPNTIGPPPPNPDLLRPVQPQKRTLTDLFNEDQARAQEAAAPMQRYNAAVGTPTPESRQRLQTARGPKPYVPQGVVGPNPFLPTPPPSPAGLAKQGLDAGVAPQAPGWGLVNGLFGGGINALNQTRDAAREAGNKLRAQYGQPQSPAHSTGAFGESRTPAVTSSVPPPVSGVPTLPTAMNQPQSFPGANVSLGVAGHVAGAAVPLAVGAGIGALGGGSRGAMRGLGAGAGYLAGAHLGNSMGGYGLLGGALGGVAGYLGGRALTPDEEEPVKPRRSKRAAGPMVSPGVHTPAAPQPVPMPFKPSATAGQVPMPKIEAPVVPPTPSPSVAAGPVNTNAPGMLDSVPGNEGWMGRLGALGSHLGGAAGTGLVGAGIGGLYGALFPGEDEEGEQNSRLGSGLTGAAMGGAVGAGLGATGIPQRAVTDMLPKLAEDKTALLSWGGGQYHLGPNAKKWGVGVEAGYSNLGGVVPIPHVGVRVGTPYGGLGVSGPLPGISIDNGNVANNRWQRNLPRGVWEYLYDRANDQDVYEVPGHGPAILPDELGSKLTEQPEKKPAAKPAKKEPTEKKAAGPLDYIRQQHSRVRTDLQGKVQQLPQGQTTGTFVQGKLQAPAAPALPTTAPAAPKLPSQSWTSPRAGEFLGKPAVSAPAPKIKSESYTSPEAASFFGKASEFAAKLGTSLNPMFEGDETRPEMRLQRSQIKPWRQDGNEAIDDIAKRFDYGKQKQKAVAIGEARNAK